MVAARTVSYFVERPTLLTHLFERIETDWLSPTLWGVAWLMLTVAILSRRQDALVVSMGVTMAIVFLWGILFLWSDPVEFLSRGSVYLAVCGFAVWGTERPVMTKNEEDGDAVGCPANGR